MLYSKQCILIQCLEATLKNYSKIDRTMSVQGWLSRTLLKAAYIKDFPLQMF